MLISLDSPLRRVPQGLDRRQQIALDGLRVSADSLDVCYGRLCLALAALPSVVPETEERVKLSVAINIDAWSLVDYSHRFSELLAQMPRVKKNLPQFQLLHRSAAQAEELRHFIQHARNEIDALADSGLSIWGSLTWILKADYDAGKKIKHSLSMGTFYSGNFVTIGRIPEACQREVDCIELHAGSRSMELTNVLRHVSVVIRGFEQDIADQAGHLPRHASDFLASMHMKEASSSQPSSRDTGDA